jgi:hypothetical protein
MLSILLLIISYIIIIYGYSFWVRTHAKFQQAKEIENQVQADRPALGRFSSVMTSYDPIMFPTCSHDPKSHRYTLLHADQASAANKNRQAKTTRVTNRPKHQMQTNP